MDLDPRLIESLLRLIELKDASTAAHSWRVVLYARALAERVGVEPDAVERLTRAAALHDLGKIDVPEDILRKPGPLTAPERAIMQTHALAGYQRLRDMQVTCRVALDLVRHHHERWDGSGYPDRLAGEAIAIPARVFGVIDTFDAMTSVRPYRAALGDDAVRRALGELHAGRGTAYWPQAVDLFVSMWETGELSWIHDHFNDASIAGLPGEAPLPSVPGPRLAHPLHR